MLLLSPGVVSSCDVVAEWIGELSTASPTRGVGNVANLGAIFEAVDNLLAVRTGEVPCRVTPNLSVMELWMAMLVDERGSTSSS